MPSLRQRVLVAIGLGVFAFVLCYVELERRDQLAADFTWIWRGAQELLAGRNPYDDPTIGKDRGLPYPHNAPLYYPVHALLVGVPFSWMPAKLAGATFFGLSCAVLAYVLSKEGYTRLPLFFSATFFVSAQSAQWGPFIMAAALIPVLLGFTLAKPNLGAAVVAAYLTRIGLASIVVVSLVTIAVMPTWPIEWWSNLGQNHHSPPVLALSGFGLVLLLAVGSLRLASARLLTVVALAPQLIWWNDPLILWLIPKTLLQSLFITGMSWVGYAAWCIWSYGPQHVNIPESTPYIFVGAYFPALLLVIWQSYPIAQIVMRARYAWQDR